MGRNSYSGVIVLVVLANCGHKEDAPTDPGQFTTAADDRVTDPFLSDGHHPNVLAQIGNTVSVIHDLNPSAWWKVGESSTSGNTMLDSAHSLNGNYYNGFALGQPAAILAQSSDRDTSVGFPFAGPVPNGFGSVPSDKSFSLTQVWDKFDSPNFPGDTWGTAKPRSELSWVAQVTTSKDVYYVDGNEAIIAPTLSDQPSGTFQQGISPTAISMLSGEMQITGTWDQQPSSGTLQPIVLVAQRTDDMNMVRAELQEVELPTGPHLMQIQIIQVIGGINHYVDTEPLEFSVPTCISGNKPECQCQTGIGPQLTHTLGDKWFLRFHFDGTDLRARAWKENTTEPTCWNAKGTSDSATAGSVAVRTANSASDVTPNVFFQGFWVQSIGLTISMFMFADANQQFDSGNGGQTWAFGKGADGGTGDLEYYARYTQGAMPGEEALHLYTFNISGGYGAGQSFSGMITGQWYHVVMELDPGDYNDTMAGVNAYINGVLDPELGTTGSPGSLYKADYECPNSCPGGPGGSGKCPGTNDDCWLISPMSQNRSFQIGTTDNWPPQWFFAGGFDEVAIFPRKLSCSEVTQIYNSACLPPGKNDLPDTGLIASASSYVSPNLPGRAVDAFETTYWLSSNSDPQSITVDLGSVQDIAQVSIEWGATYGTFYQILVSDDNINWTSALNVKSAVGGIEKRNVGKSGRYLKINGTHRNNSGGYTIKDLKVYKCPVAPPNNCQMTCGDGRCDPGEDNLVTFGGVTEEQCAQDCCGNGACTGFENEDVNGAKVCWTDCH